MCFDPDKKVPRTDKIHLYATQVLTLSLFWDVFHDAIREGDGDRILSYWKFLLIIFRVKGHRNYCKEAIILLTQYHCLLSERKAAQMKWSRFVNVSGKKGGNIPCDLHLEHLNRRLKGLITDLHSNASSCSRNLDGNIYPNNALNRAARSIGILNNISSTFEEQSEVTPESVNHNVPQFARDVQKVLEVLEDERVFEQKKRNGNIHHLVILMLFCNKAYQNI